MPDNELNNPSFEKPFTQNTLLQSDVLPYDDTYPLIPDGFTRFGGLPWWKAGWPGYYSDTLEQYLPSYKPPFGETNALSNEPAASAIFDFKSAVGGKDNPLVFVYGTSDQVSRSNDDVKAEARFFSLQMGGDDLQGDPGLELDKSGAEATITVEECPGDPDSLTGEAKCPDKTDPTTAVFTWTAALIPNDGAVSQYAYEFELKDFRDG